MPRHLTVDEYIAAQPDAVRPLLERVRGIIRDAVPAAEERISYGMPSFRLGGSTILFFAGWKNHYALYPGNARLVAALGEDLAPYEVSKGTIRFPLDEPVPAELIRRIARLRAKEAADGEA